MSCTKVIQSELETAGGKLIEKLGNLVKLFYQATLGDFQFYLGGRQASIQGDSVRVTGKKRDDLQTAMALLKEKDPVGLPLQFNNFRD